MVSDPLFRPMPSASRSTCDDDGDYITVARRLDPIAAELLRGRLAADGIPARLADAHLVQTYSLWATALGGVRVMVPSSWAPQALRAIAAIEQGELALEDAASGGDEGTGDERPAGGWGHGGPLVAGVAALLLLLAVASAVSRLATVVP